MRPRLLPFVVFAVLAAPLAAADQPPDPIAENVFPPELVMQSQAEIQLTDAQREAIKAEVLKAQGRLQTAQWDLQSEVSKLAALLKAEKPDEARVLASLKTVLDLERDVKTTQITLLVRLKGVLTHEQQVRLAELRARRH
jgi:Spy/CpxP family protein refolding chaperone